MMQVDGVIIELESSSSTTPFRTTTPEPYLPFAIPNQSQDSQLFSQEEQTTEGVIIVTQADSKSENNSMQRSSVPSQFQKMEDSGFFSFAQPKRRVLFQEHSENCPFASPLEMLDRSEWGALWYSALEQSHFRTQVHEQCRKLRTRMENVRCDNKSVANVNTVDQEDDYDTTRGLEYGACLERQRRKRVGKKDILRAAKEELRNDPERLSRLAQTHNQRAVDIAQKEARRDFSHTYANRRIEQNGGVRFDDSPEKSNSTCCTTVPPAIRSQAPRDKAMRLPIRV